MNTKAFHFHSLTTEDVRDIFRRIAFAEGNQKHGDFLTSFAKAVVHADPENFDLLLPTAGILIFKYQLAPSRETSFPA